MVFSCKLLRRNGSKTKTSAKFWPDKILQRETHWIRDLSEEYI